MQSQNEDISRRIHYLLRQWLCAIDINDLKSSMLIMKNDYDYLPSELKNLLEICVEELVNGIDPYIEKALIDAERYASLDMDVRRYFESDINSAFLINDKLREAVKAHQLMQKINLHLNKINSVSCLNCELYNFLINNKSKISSI